MRDSLQALVLLVVLAVSLPVIAQKGAKKAPAELPPTTVADARSRAEKPRQYDDSVEFNKTFKEFFPLIKPKNTVRELAEKQVDRQLLMFKNQGVDSAEVVKIAYAGLDENAAYKIYHEIYRQKLSAKDLKAYLAFLRTSEGAKIHSINLELSRAPAEVNTYITKTVNTNLMPIRTQMRDNMLKSQKEKDVQMKSDTTETGKLYRQQMHMRDSILKARGIDPKTFD